MTVSSGRMRRAFSYTAAVLSVSALYAGSVGLIVPTANAEDDRDSVNVQVQASESRISELQHSLEGIDANLAKVFLELEGMKASIPVAEKELAAAEERFEAADREHQVILDQLKAAEGEKSRLEKEISQAQEDEEEARQALGNLARTLYQEGDPSALSVVLTEESARDISQRVAAAESLTRLQGAAVSSALDTQEKNKNHVLRQGAVTDRIADLEEKAAAAAQEAEQSKKAASDKVDELRTLKAQADAKQKEWSTQKDKAAAQLKKEEAEYAAAKEKLAKIDEENRKKGLSYVGANGWGAPLRIGLQVTSPFGWRLHPVLGYARLHNGTDFAAGCGTPIYPTAPGVVSAVTVEEAGGNVVYVNHGMRNGNSYMSAYVHLEGTNVYPGQSVDTNSVVGWVGATGYATGCHLHFSFMENGADVDPMDYL